MKRSLWIAMLVLLGLASGCSLFESERGGSGGGGDGDNTTARAEAAAALPYRA